MDGFGRSLSPEWEEEEEGGEISYPEGYSLYEPEDADDVLAWIQTILEEAVERAIPDPKVVLTLEEGARRLSVLGKIWNLTECPEGCEIDSVECETSDERLLDMEGYVDEYQYLHLEAVNMGLTDIRIIPKHFIWLLSADLSGNNLTNTSACPLTKLQNIVSVELNRNRIRDPYLEPMKHLQHLGLNANKIESIHRIYHPNLLSLDVNWNNIRKIDGRDCWKLKRLKELELRGNKLKTTSGIEYQNLVALYAAENQITRLLGLNRLPNLEILHLRKNPLSDLSGFTADNRKLRYLNVRSCQIGDVPELEKLKTLESLEVLIVTDNLFNPSPDKGAQDEDDNENGNENEQEEDVKIRILAILPHLKRINKRRVTREDLKKARDATGEEQEEFFSGDIIQATKLSSLPTPTPPRGAPRSFHEYLNATT